ncbi:hypothetical protein KGQ71_04315 [Patescibacteria group bacterium]|nr:hypothetical protein [Patescibacteria group bacterium]
MRHPFHLPTRVSRLYPIFALTLAITNAIFIYAWQSADLTLSNLSVVEQRNEALHNQVDQLTSQQSIDKSTLAFQKQEIGQNAQKLADLQKQIKAETDSLAAKDALLQQAQKQVAAQQAQLTSNASELEQLRNRPPLFSFQNQSGLADINQKEADVKALVTNAFPYIQKIYGQPYLLHQVSITFVNSLSIAGSSGEIVIKNGPGGISMDIQLEDFDKNSFQDNNTIIHEIVHAFHGIAVLDTSALEEGITVAATDAIMQAMINDGKLPDFGHLYLILSDQEYADWNTALHIPADNTLFYSSPDIAKIYQVIGKAWYRLYQQNGSFFKDFNAAYYPKVQKGISPDNALVLDTIRSVIPYVGSQSIDDYLKVNQAFDPT